MKKIMIFAFVMLAGMISINLQANTYELNNAEIDQLFAQAEVVDAFAVQPMAPLAGSAGTSEAYFVEDKDPLVAFLLSWFLGYLGIHRAYLGTSTGTIVGYILTIGGCGIVATIDWIMLLIGLINNDISQYVDNPKFFMW